MTRLLPHPLLSFALLLMWLALTRFTLGHALLGGAIAIVAGRAMASLHPAGPRIRRWDVIPVLFAVVVRDILRSNLAVAWLILTRGRGGKRAAGFVSIPLVLRDETALAWLAIIVTATPGTAWIEYDSGRSTLLIHVFDLTDPEEMRTFIKQRYEVMLMEIFE